MPSVKVGSGSSFSTSIVIPLGATLGAHVISVVEVKTLAPTGAGEVTGTAPLASTLVPIGGTGATSIASSALSNTPAPAPSPIHKASAAAYLTPAPTLRPTPTPMPTRTLRPLPAGVVPPTIDATGRVDASAALVSFLSGVPDGSTIVFKSGGVYLMDSALKLTGRHNLVFEGNGATLKSNGDTTEASSLFWIGRGSSGITIRDFRLVGNSPTPGVYQSGREGAHGILVDGSSNVQIANVTVRGVWGDCFYVGSWADTVWIHDSTCESSGRNGVTVTAGKNVTVERVAFEKSGYCTFDIEPNVNTEGAANILIVDNTAGTFGQDFAAVEGSHTGAPINGIAFNGNTISGGTLRTIIDNGGTSRMRNIVFTNNTSTVAGVGPILIFAHIDDLTVTGNVQPLISGSLASITDSTGVTYP